MNIIYIVLLQAVDLQTNVQLAHKSIRFMCNTHNDHKSQNKYQIKAKSRQP